MRFEFNNMSDGYLELRDAILRDGNEVSPRGFLTKELQNVTYTLLDPTKPAPVGLGRGLNPKIGAAEAAHLVGGYSDAQQLVNCAKNFGMFVEKDRLKGAYGPRTFVGAGEARESNGSYGPRSASQWTNVIETLSSDPDSRQAGVVIWRPWELDAPSKDVPCTVALFFNVRDGKLNMSVVMRSQDLVWGVPYDAMMFTAAQRALAHALRLELGSYTHFAMSLHIYMERDGDSVASWSPGQAPEFEQPTPYGNRYYSREAHNPLAVWQKIQRDMHRLAGISKSPSDELCFKQHQWYVDVLEGTQSGNLFCAKCRYVLPRTEYHFSKAVLADSTYRARYPCKQCELESAYGLDAGGWDRMFTAQHGRCAICQRADRDLKTDHDHATGGVRGLLCSPCNQALGIFGDNEQGLQRAVQYLRTDGVGWPD